MVRRNLKLQSAMEYLMTYGWAILIIGVVLGTLFALGVFSGTNLLGTFCTATTGYYCQSPVLTSSNSQLAFNFGQDSGTTWDAWALSASTGTSYDANAPTSQTYTNLVSGAQVPVIIPLSSILGNSISIGTPFSGSIWATYCTTGAGCTPNLVSEVATINIKSS